MNEPPLKSFETREERNRFIDDLQQLITDAKDDNLTNTLVLVLQSKNLDEPSKVNGRLYRSFQNDQKQEMAIHAAFMNLLHYLPMTKTEENETDAAAQVNIPPSVQCPNCGSMIILKMSV
jgi:hypothetical protein